MILALDIGNTQLYGGVFFKGKLILQFRKGDMKQASSDELGIFFRNVLRENGKNPEEVKAIGCCSVVPSINHSVKNACLKYFNLDPFFLKTGVKTGLKIRYKNPGDVGADRIANSVGATALFPGKNLIIADFGTATTLEVVTKDKEYLGGAIVPGLKISMLSLESHTAKLPRVEIVTPLAACGRTTTESIQAGLFYSHLGMLKEICGRMKEECFNGEEAILIATGGFSRLFESVNFFDRILPNLVLEGLKTAMELNGVSNI